MSQDVTTVNPSTAKTVALSRIEKCTLNRFTQRNVASALMMKKVTDFGPLVSHALLPVLLASLLTSMTARNADGDVPSAQKKILVIPVLEDIHLLRLENVLMSALEKTIIKILKVTIALNVQKVAQDANMMISSKDLIASTVLRTSN